MKLTRPPWSPVNLNSSQLPGGRRVEAVPQNRGGVVDQKKCNKTQDGERYFQVGRSAKKFRTEKSMGNV